MYMLMCIILSTIILALYRTIRVVYLHNVSIIAIGVESAYRERERSARTTHVVHVTSLYYKPLHLFPLYLYI
jgi:hypothetical protein